MKAVCKRGGRDLGRNLEGPTDQDAFSFNERWRAEWGEKHSKSAVEAGLTQPGRG